MDIHYLSVCLFHILFYVYCPASDFTIIAYHDLYPPNSKCINVTNCLNASKGLLRRKDGPRRVTVYYGINGAYVGFSVHLLCHRKSRWTGFKFAFHLQNQPHDVDSTTNYHHNVSVNTEFRTYYGGVPNLIQVGEHQFIEKRVQRVVNLIIGMMLIAWYVDYLVLVGS
jgi:KDZ transposase family protein